MGHFDFVHCSTCIEPLSQKKKFHDVAHSLEHSAKFISLVCIFHERKFALKVRYRKHGIHKTFWKVIKSNTNWNERWHGLCVGVEIFIFCRVLGCFSWAPGYCLLVVLCVFLSSAWEMWEKKNWKFIFPGCWKICSFSSSSSTPFSLSPSLWAVLVFFPFFFFHCAHFEREKCFMWSYSIERRGDEPERERGREWKQRRS